MTERNKRNQPTHYYSYSTIKQEPARIIWPMTRDEYNALDITEQLRFWLNLQDGDIPPNCVRDRAGNYGAALRQMQQRALSEICELRARQPGRSNPNEIVATQDRALQALGLGRFTVVPEGGKKR